MEDDAVVHRRGAADCDVRSDADGAGIGGGFLEAAAVPPGQSFHLLLKVNVFSVVNLLLPS